jgi:VIT1/CCC1 family predicted Fe2+/Mn2+ transporter
MPRTTHPELHRSERIGWLRAAVLGANDGIVSTASLMVGVAAAGTGRGELLVTGIAGLVAGAMSMAAGEYVSVRSQSDTEHADLSRERAELATQPALEKQELASIYVARGLKPELAARVAEQLMAHDALGAHARDELGISPQGNARPVQASFTSAASFAAGSALPILTALAVPGPRVVPILIAASVVMLAVLGALAARVGRAAVLPASIRVAVLGAMAMAVTAGVGRLFGAVV